jgi:hypothetical protein
MTMHARRVAPLLLLAFVTGCPTHVERPYADPGAQTVINYIKALPERARSLRAETVSDAYIGEDRFKLTVLMMATWGGKLRYMAMSPGGGNMAADLASDGNEFCFIDANKNCGECGPATPENVGQLIRVVLEPDDVVAIMLGGTPLLEGAEATLTWDRSNGHEILTLVRPDGMKQRVELGGAEHHWEVLFSEVKDPDGKLVFRVRNGRYHTVKTASGGSIRLPGRSEFDQPGNNVRIDWKEQEVDVELGDDKFHLDVPVGLPICQ